MRAVKCRHCPEKFVSNKGYFGHARTAHFHLPARPKKDPKPQESQKEDKDTEDESEAAEAKDSKPKLPAAPEAPVSLKESEYPELLSQLFPKFAAVPMNPKKKYKCAVCHDVCDIHALFAHMKQVLSQTVFIWYHPVVRGPHWLEIAQ